MKSSVTRHDNRLACHLTDNSCRITFLRLKICTILKNGGGDWLKGKYVQELFTKLFLTTKAYMKWYILVYISHSRYSDGLRTEWQRSDFWQVQRYLYLLHSVQTGSGATPASYPMGIGDSFPEVKRPKREADCSPPYSAKVKNCGAITPLPHTFY
jgi:hypothetical protein